MGEAQQEVQKVYFKEQKSDNLSKEQLEVLNLASKILKQDLAFYSSTLKIEETQKESSEKEGLQVELKTQVSIQAQLLLTFSIEDLTHQKQIYIKKLELASNFSRSSIHQIAHDILKIITKKDSIFLSHLIFVCEIGRGAGRHKEIFQADFDGYNTQQLTHHRSIVLSPAFSPDNKKIVYSLINNRMAESNNVDLYIYDTMTLESKAVSFKDGINSGAIFSGDGKHLIFTLMPKRGNADIFEMNLLTQKIRPLTQHYSDDVDPSLNKTGDRLVFLSDRAGKAMIYSLDPKETEKNVKRLSFVGKFNSTPRFSPLGDEVIFSAWVDQGFDLYRLKLNPKDFTAGEVYRLTKNFGSNENATYSPDGEFIAFSSLKKASKFSEQTIHIMNKEGVILYKIPQKSRRCQSPRWSN
ncbi:MAG: PD40 domain-containing protein [Bacteriovoracaceae bacterium]|nr:PD40 domain-containing protein [Bacteriovoracaceae bacterium]